MKFALIVAHAAHPENTWRENYSDAEIETVDQAKAYGAKLIDGFNSSLRPHETARVLIDVELDPNADTKTPHKWEKSALVTQMDPARGMFDPVRCKVCGAVARRYGINLIKRQKPFTALKWATCPGKTS